MHSRLIGNIAEALKDAEENSAASTPLPATAIRPGDCAAVRRRIRRSKAAVAAGAGPQACLLPRATPGRTAPAAPRARSGAWPCASWSTLQ